MTVSVIVPTIRANPDLLEACICAVVETTGLTPMVAEGGTFAESCNAGAAQADTDIVLFLNDDASPLPGWLPPLVAAFDNPNTRIAGSKLVYPDGRIQHAGVGFRDSGLLEAYNILEDLPSRYVEAVTGACMAVRSSTFEELGGFDTGYINGYEDVDLCIRADVGDESIRYVAESVVVHHESQSGPARWTHVRENVERLQRWA